MNNISVDYTFLFIYFETPHVPQKTPPTKASWRFAHVRRHLGGFEVAAATRRDAPRIADAAAAAIAAPQVVGQVHLTFLCQKIEQELFLSEAARNMQFDVVVWIDLVFLVFYI